MTYILLYIPPPYKVSGGLGNFKLFFDICRSLGFCIYYCPIFKNIPSIGFTTPFHDRHIDTISHKELINYYIKCPEPVEYINPNDIVPPNILRTRNNIVIYPEDVMGNPSEQKYIVRWLFYFPIPSVLPYYNFDNEYICFYSDYIYNFYKYVCIACGIPDLLTTKLKSINVHRVFKFEPEIYKSIKNNRAVNRNLNNNRKCFTIRKLFPPLSFDSFNTRFNATYGKEIMENYNTKLTFLRSKLIEPNSISSKKNYMSSLIQLKKNVPDLKKYSVIREYLTNKFKSFGYDHVEHKNSSLEFINYFQKKDFFLSFDPFTFMSIIASLCGCTSVVKKIHGLNFDEWVSGDPFNKYGVAYGDDGIEHAVNTQHLLLEHITNMYSQNENNVLNFMNNIEKHFNIKINNNRIIR